MSKLGEGATPGPWQVAVYGEGERCLIKRGELSIAHIDYVDDGNTNKITHANARLIAKAPLLVEARDVLEACLARFAEDGIEETHINHPIALARALLAKLEEE